MSFLTTNVADNVGAIVDLMVCLLLAVVTESQFGQLALASAVLSFRTTILAEQRLKSATDAFSRSSILLLLLLGDHLVCEIGSLRRHVSIVNFDF